MSKQELQRGGLDGHAVALGDGGLPNEEIVIADGVVSAGDKRASFADFADLAADGTFATTIRTYSYGAHA
jgi:hypothetical protein